MKTIIFFDIDGTLLPPGKNSLEKSTIKAIKKAQEDGISIVACTGRCKEQAKEYIDQAGITSYITSNGQEVICEGKEIYNFEFDTGKKEALFSHIRNNNLHPGYENSYGIYIAQEKNSYDIKEMIDKEKLLDTEINSQYIRDGVKQVWAFGDKKDLDNLNLKDLSSNCYRWSDCSMQIAPASQSKGKGIQIFKNYFKDINNIQQLKTYGFGDSLNDFAMFKEVDIRVAMGNASDELQKEADFIADKSGDSGISKMMIKLGLIR